MIDMRANMLVRREVARIVGAEKGKGLPNPEFEVNNKAVYLKSVRATGAKKIEDDSEETVDLRHAIERNEIVVKPFWQQKRKSAVFIHCIVNEVKLLGVSWSEFRSVTWRSWSFVRRPAELPRARHPLMRVAMMTCNPPALNPRPRLRHISNISLDQ